MDSCSYIDVLVMACRVDGERKTWQEVYSMRMELVSEWICMNIKSVCTVISPEC